MTTALQIALGLFALGLGVLGAQLIAQGPAALAGIGHTPEALPQVLGGRFIGMGVAILALVALSEWRAVSVVLAAGALMGVIDWFVEPAVFASSHIGFAIACSALAAATMFLARRSS